jgi:hypothetical protein
MMKRKQQRWSLVAAATAAMTVATNVVASAPASAGVVAVGYEVALPDEATEPLRELAAELDAQGMAARGPSIATALGASEPLSAITDSKLTASDIFQQIASGYRLWLRGEFSTAEAQLSAAMRTIGRNPGLVVSDAAFRDSITRALVGLALSRKRLKNQAGATEAMTELIRTLPEQPVTTALFGPEAEKFYQEVRRKLDTVDRGKLIVDVNRSNAQIFINEQGRAKGATFTSDMLPGEYRIMVQVSGESRRYVVNIKGNAESRLSLDWEASQYVRSTGDGLMVKLPDGQLGNGETVTRRFLHAAGINSGVFGMLLVDGNGIVGSVVGADTPRVMRSARIVFGPGATARAQRLAKYLATGQMGEGVEPLKASPNKTPTEPLANKPADKPVAKPADKPVDKPVAKPADKPADNPVADKPAGLSTKTVAERDAEFGDEDTTAVAEPSTDAPRVRKSAYGWAALGTGVLAVGGIATGGYLLSLDGKPTCDQGIAQCPDLYDTKTPAYAALAGGGALAVVTGILTYAWASSGSRTNVAMAPTRGGFMAAVGWQF